MTLRCRLPLSSLDEVYSYPMNVVKCPGSLNCSAASIVSANGVRSIVRPSRGGVALLQAPGDGGLADAGPRVVATSAID